MNNGHETVRPVSILNAVSLTHSFQDVRINAIPGFDNSKTNEKVQARCSEE
jgi:hypothetical protein